jgi:putative phage-type endonuclease
MQQRTPEWYAAKVGKLSGSLMADAIAFKKDGKETQARADLRLDLVAERLTGILSEKFISRYMRWGIEFECQARAAVESEIGHIIEEVGFIDHPSIPWLGCSPDGLTGDLLLEIKCPTPRVHLEYIMGGVVPEEYIPQTLCNLAVTGKSFALFASYDPRMPKRHQLYIKEFKPARSQLDEIEEKAVQFLKEVDEVMDRLNEH